VWIATLPVKGEVAWGLCDSDAMLAEKSIVMDEQAEGKAI